MTAPPSTRRESDPPQAATEESTLITALNLSAYLVAPALGAIYLTAVWLRRPAKQAAGRPGYSPGRINTYCHSIMMPDLVWMVE